tara:strand:+ start:370 stop:909 length:540 start_codon:yes stop_codon:yes gene_type:complete
MIIQESGNGGGELPPKKPQSAVCVGVIDVGEAYGIAPGPDGRRLVPSTNPNFPDPKQKVRFVFESEEKMEDGQPFRLSRQFNVSLSDKGYLLPFLSGWGVELVKTGDGIDLEASCVGKVAMVNVTHDPDRADPERVWANISTAMPSDAEIKPSGEFDKTEYMKKAAEKYAERQSGGSPY